MQIQRALHLPPGRGTSSDVLTETFVQPEHLFMHACTQVNVRAACAAAGTSEQDVTCVWSSATTHRDHVLDELGRKPGDLLRRTASYEKLCCGHD